MSLLNNITELTLPEHGSQYAEWKAIDGNYVISPSGARNFIANRRNWYVNTILKEKTFNGNLNTTIGSLIHQVAEDYYNGVLGVNGLVDSWKVKQISKDYPEAVEEYERLSPIFLNEYLVNSKTPHSVEGYLEYELTHNVRVCGSYDALEATEGTEGYTLIDYKTSGSSSKDMEAHILQLSIYALALQATKGLIVDKLRIVQIVKTKTPNINVIEDVPNIEYAKEVLTNMVYSIHVAKEFPTLVDLIFPENVFDFSSEVKLGFNPTVKSYSKEDTQIEEAKKSIFS